MPSPTFSATGHPEPTPSLSSSEWHNQPSGNHWEEPHPGHLLPGLTESTPPSWGHRYVGAGVAGEFRNGMAAKGYHDHRGHKYRIQRPFTVRRDIRVRRHHKTPVRRVETHDAKSGGPNCSLVNIEPLPENTAEAQPRDSSVDADGDTATITDAGTEAEVATTVTEQTLVPSHARPSHGALGDVSNLLGICEDDEDYRPVTALDPSALRAGPCEDIYGWEAELDRKMSASDRRKDTPGLNSLATSVRRSNQGARRLIHRVFSMGPSQAGEFNPGRRASTAN